MKNEKRRDPRFLAKERTYALFSSDVSRVGIVKDISRGGLSLEYVTVYGEAGQAASEGPESGTVDVLLATEEGQLTKLPCEVVYTTTVERAPSYWASRVPVRRCGLRFGNLSERHRRRIDAFLAHHVVRPAPEPGSPAAG